MQVINFASDEIYKTFFKAEMAISIIPYMVALSFLVVPLIRMFKAKQKIGLTFTIPIVFIAIYIILHEALHSLNLSIKWINTYLNGDTGFIMSWLMLIICLVILGIAFYLKWHLQKKSIKNL